MALRSVLVDTTALVKHEKYRFSYKWMRHFFSTDMSPANHAVIFLQRRAVYIGLALILQALNEVPQVAASPLLGSFSSLLPLALFSGSFWAMWMALRANPSAEPGSELPFAPPAPTKRWQRILLILTLVLTIAGGVEMVRGVVNTFYPAQFTNDGTSLDTNAAILLTQGRNPYTDSNMPELLRRFKTIEPNWTTPLRAGQFANRLDYPQMAELQSVLNTSLKADSVPEFEAKVSYPSLSFLTLVPFVLLKQDNVFPFYILCYLALVLVAWKMVQPALRPWVLLLAAANVPMWSSAIGGNLDVLYTLLIVVAWLQRDRRWLSAIFIGLALASKQIAWYFLPFYLIMVWRHYGIKEAVYRCLIAGLIGLATNLPFILWNPHAWVAGVMAPIADPMFPMGVGVIGLSVSHLIPYLPEKFYSVIEYGTMLLTMGWYWRICRKTPEAAILLAILPLFLAWRSLASYFYCVAFPLFVLMAAKQKPAPLTYALPASPVAATTASAQRKVQPSAVSV